jgi:molybdopterin molybdotransferase
VLPALYRASGRRPRAGETALLSQDVSFKPKLTNFLPVRLVGGGDGRLVAQPAPTNTSGDFMSLSGTDGYVELDRDTSEFPKDTVVPLYRWDTP